MADPAEAARPWVESVADEHGPDLVAGLAAEYADAQPGPGLEAEIAEAMRTAEEAARA